MSRAARSRLSPWIENLILSYDSQQRSSSSVRLKAHVIGVGEVSQSQAQNSDSPTGLLFLSDGVLQIPAVLTALAWDHLQDQEDRESFSSLLNTTVCIRDYRLQFHMAQEQTKCRFFLSVGELATTAAGPVKDNTPCCTTIFSVRQKICMTWRVLLHQEVLDSQASQCGFDLSELLGEWHHDCMQAVLEDVKERLMAVCSRPMNLQPSTSYSCSMLTQQDTSVATGWDVDRVRYKALKSFSIPMKYLLIPAKNALELQTEGNVGRMPIVPYTTSLDCEEESPQVCEPSEIAQPIVDYAEWKIGTATVLETYNSSTNDFPSAEESMVNEDMLTRMVDRPLSNPWDIFPPLCTTSSSSDVSPEATSNSSLHNAGTVSKSDQFVTSMNTQLLVHSLKDSWQMSEHNYLPPYQKLPNSSSFPTTSGYSATTSVNIATNELPATNDHTNRAQHKCIVLDQENQSLDKDVENIGERKYRKAKRKRCDFPPEALTNLEDEEEDDTQINRSPTSWPFHTRADLRDQEDGCHQQPPTVRTVSRTVLTGPLRTPNSHSDGKPFSYTYQMSGQNLQDLSHFKVSESLLCWAVKYLLVPGQTDNQHTIP